MITYKNAGDIRIVFLKTKEQLIPIASTDLELSDEEIIEIYKRRWDIEQEYKDLRTHFGFGKEEYENIYASLLTISSVISIE